MFKEAAVLAVALASPSLIEAVAIQKRDGAHGHDHSHDHAAAPAPSSGYSAPASGYSAPASGYSAPASGYSAPASGYSAPASGYSAPASGYGAPDTGYGAPATGYGAPATGYGAPDTGYGAPATGYDEPTGYDAPSYGGGGEAALPDLTPIIVGILALVGLSLLFPTFVNVTGRRKRSADGVEGSAYDVVERVNDIYSSVINSESCLQRVACEVGGLASDVGIQDMARMADAFVPAKYKAYYKQFASGQDCHKIKCGSLAF